MRRHNNLLFRLKRIFIKISKKLAISAIIFFGMLCLWYFNTYTISGTIVDENTKPLPYVEISQQSYIFGKLIEERPISRSDENGKFLINNLRSGNIHLLFSYMAEHKNSTYRVVLAKEYGTIYFNDITKWKLSIDLQNAFENSFKEIKNNKKIVVYFREGKKYITVR